MFCYTTCLKITLNEKGVHPLDMCLVRTLFMCFGSWILGCVMKAPFKIEKSDRCALLARSIFGTIGFTTITFGVAMVPLVVQQTLFNTAPFWASMLGWFFNSEKISGFEILAMLVSFGGVLCIALSGHSNDDDSATAVGTKEEDKIPGSHLIGSGLVFCTSWCYAFVGILTRRMQKVNFAVMLFYYAIVAFLVTCMMIAGECLVNGSHVRLFSDYSATQFGWMFLVSVINYIGLNCNTIALQNERSGFITLLGYIGLVYAFLGDWLIFNEVLYLLEICGILVIVVMNIMLICTKWTNPTAAAAPVVKEI